ncbi:hypothetical protein ACXR2T_14405 [Leucobacter sp. HY1910]
MNTSDIPRSDDDTPSAGTGGTGSSCAQDDFTINGVPVKHLMAGNFMIATALGLPDAGAHMVSQPTTRAQKETPHDEH